MPNSAAAKKRLRQSIDRRDRNRAAKSTLRSKIRKVRSAVKAGDAAEAQTAMKVVVKALDQAAAKNLIHKNVAARTKSRLNKAVKSIQG